MSCRASYSYSDWMRVAHRENDLRDPGYCPKCGRRLAGLTNKAKGFCEEHGWVFAEWTAPREAQSDDEEDS